ncbi:MAG TPA: hypothetical protein VFC05_06720 [Nitrososphaeraceae archaeon]|jgi:hypothetical protein|nr:hypothetical protein [Nitrososphaeraceae archaeon]HZL22998.1 hypothetical protein [Nitrososphaeraceae archaeon]
MMLSTLSKKTSVKNTLKWIFSGLSILFIVLLIFMLIHDSLTGVSSQTAEYCAKYGFLASPDCW